MGLVAAGIVTAQRTHAQTPVPGPLEAESAIEARRAVIRGTDDEARFRLQLTIMQEAREGLDVVAVVRPLLSDSSARVRAQAVEVLKVDEFAEARPQDVAVALELLRGALRDPTPEVRRAAADQLVACETFRSGEAAPDLIQALQDPDAGVRRTAVYGLGQMGPAAAPAVPRLIAMTGDEPAWEVRWLAVRALGWLGDLAESAVPTLLPMLRSASDTLRAEAVASLGSIGVGGVAAPYASQVVAGLTGALADTLSHVRRAAIAALGSLGSPGASAVVAALRHPDDTVAARAAVILGQGDPDSVAIVGLLAALGDRRTLVRDEAADALGGLGAHVRPALLAAQRGADTRPGATRALTYLDRAFRSPVADDCYQLHRGPWRPDLGLAGDTVFSRPPEIVRFSTRKHRQPYDPKDPVPMHVWPANGSRMSVHGPGGWTSSADGGTIEVAWSTGFSGVTMKLDVVGDGAELRGTARPFWDFPRESQTADVTATRVACAPEAQRTR